MNGYNSCATCYKNNSVWSKHHVSNLANQLQSYYKLIYYTTCKDDNMLVAVSYTHLTLPTILRV